MTLPNLVEGKDPVEIKKGIDFCRQKIKELEQQLKLVMQQLKEKQEILLEKRESESMDQNNFSSTNKRESRLDTKTNKSENDTLN